MSIKIPSADQVRARLESLSRQDLIKLSATSGVSFNTVLKIKRGETADPRIETVRQIWPFLPAERVAVAKAA
jgi:hypothetical protein